MFVLALDQVYCVSAQQHLLFSVPVLKELISRDFRPVAEESDENLEKHRKELLIR